MQAVSLILRQPLSTIAVVLSLPKRVVENFRPSEVCKQPLQGHVKAVWAIQLEL